MAGRPHVSRCACTVLCTIDPLLWTLEQPVHSFSVTALQAPLKGLVWPSAMKERNTGGHMF